MPFDPPPTDFAALQAAYQRLILERDALQREVVRLRQDNAFLTQQLSEMADERDRDYVRLL